MLKYEILIALGILAILVTFKNHPVLQNTKIATLNTSPEPVVTQSVLAADTTNSNDNLTKYQYPNSTVIESDSEKLELSSSDDPAAITSWYKNLIQQLNMHSNSFVQTNTNGNISNTINSSNAQESLLVQITKINSESTTKILVRDTKEAVSE